MEGLRVLALMAPPSPACTPAPWAFAHGTVLSQEPALLSLPNCPLRASSNPAPSPETFPSRSVSLDNGDKKQTI